MNALSITIFVGVVLAALFAILFVTVFLGRDHSNERAALLPLDDDKPRLP